MKSKVWRCRYGHRKFEHPGCYPAKLKHKISYEIRSLDQGFILEVWRWWFGFYARPIGKLAFTKFDDLKEYMDQVLYSELKQFG
jgi:hypothetical protein